MNKKWYVAGLIAIFVIALSIVFWKSPLFAKNHAAVLLNPAIPATPASPEKLLPPKIKQAVNQALEPQGATYPKSENAQGITIDVSQRAVSVSTAVIDAQGQVHIVDYTAPIKD